MKKNGLVIAVTLLAITVISAAVLYFVNSKNDDKKVTSNLHEKEIDENNVNIGSSLDSKEDSMMVTLPDGSKRAMTEVIDESYWKNLDDAASINKLVMKMYEEGLFEGFGGTKVDDNGNLVVLVNDMCNDNLSEMINRYSLRTEKCLYDYAAVKKTNELICDNLSMFINEKGIKIGEVACSNQKIVIYMYDYNYEQVNYIKSVIGDEEYVEYEEMHGSF